MQHNQRFNLTQLTNNCYIEWPYHGLQKTNVIWALGHQQPKEVSPKSLEEWQVHTPTILVPVQLDKCVNQEAILSCCVHQVDNQFY